MMPNIEVGRYESPEAGYAGWVKPSDESWILFITEDGEPQLFIRAIGEDENGKEVDGWIPAAELLQSEPA